MKTCLLLTLFLCVLTPSSAFLNVALFSAPVERNLNVLNHILRAESHWPEWDHVFTPESVMVAKAHVQSTTTQP